MSTLAPSRLKDFTDAALFMALVQDNRAILAEEVAKRLPTYQSGTPTTIIGPPTSGAHVQHEFWRDALGAEYRCTARARRGRASRPGSPPSPPTPPAGRSLPVTSSGTSPTVR